LANLRRLNMSYSYQLKSDELDFAKWVEILRRRIKNRIMIGAINNTSREIVETILKDLQLLNISLIPLRIDTNEYNRYVADAGYEIKYPSYYKDNFFEKSLEHYICYRLLDLKPSETFIDVASEHSPLGQIFSELTGCVSYSQDIMYESGIHGNMIGCDAASIPVNDGFFHKATATCSLEHFEGDSDIRFMKEMERVLIRAGMIVVVPLYLYVKHSCQTDPRYSVPGNVSFDEDADVYCAQGWGNRHGRFYSVESLYRRLIAPNKHMDFSIYFLENPQDIHSSVYCRFVFVGRKI